jgi:hypothetical protein
VKLRKQEVVAFGGRRPKSVAWEPLSHFLDERERDTFRMTRLACTCVSSRDKCTFAFSRAITVNWVATATAARWHFAPETTHVRQFVHMCESEGILSNKN